MTSIGNNAFRECTCLTNITIPDSVTSIGDLVFNGCSNLTIHGENNSCAQTYAINNDITFTAHTFGEWQTVIPAACITNGQEKSFCSICHNEKTRVLPALGHNYSSVVTAPTVSSKGYTTYTCSRCEDVYICDYTDKLGNFSDVPTGIYYYDAVQWASGANVTTGVGGGKFAPDLACTRSQVVTFLWRAMGCPEPTMTSCPFTDLPNKTIYYYQAVLWAVENNITTGTSGNTFSPDMSCSRAQIVTFLYRYKNPK